MQLPPIVFEDQQNTLDAISSQLKSGNLPNLSLNFDLFPGSLPSQISKRQVKNWDAKEVYYKVGRTTHWTLPSMMPLRFGKSAKPTKKRQTWKWRESNAFLTFLQEGLGKSSWSTWNIFVGIGTRGRQRGRECFTKYYKSRRNREKNQSQLLLLNPLLSSLLLPKRWIL